MSTRAPVVDADGHVLEPADMWLNYIDPAYKDRAIRIAHDRDGREVLLFDNKPMEMLRGQLGALGGIELDEGELGRLEGEYTYAMGSPPGGYDPHARLEVMNEEGIDKVLLYPTIGICWEGHVTEPALATAYTRAYNRWIADFCRAEPQRLYPVAHISLIDPVGAVEEVRRARQDGCVGVYLSPDMAARSGKQFTHPDFAPFWNTVSDLDMPIGFHVIVRDQPAFHEYSGQGRESSLFFFAFLAIDVMAAFTQMMSSGMFERYPKLKCAVLEAGGNWIAAWLDRLDHKYEVMRDTVPFSMKPSEYFYRQCVISADPDESMTAQVVEHMGADYVIWASDYPHIDASMGVVKEIRSRLSVLPQEAQDKVLGGNVMRFYGL